MPNVTANGIQIEYDTFGANSSPALLLVMGAGGQMIFWDFEFCELLAKRGHFVIRFDNRDVFHPFSTATHDPFPFFILQ